MTDGTGGDSGDVRRLVVAVAPRLVHAIRHRLGRLEPSLTYRQYRVLTRIGDGARSLTALRTPATVSLSTLSEIVDGLAGRGLIARIANVQDRRAVDLTLTPPGERALAAARSALDGLAERVLRDVPAGQRSGLLQALQAMDSAVQALLADEHER